jgi:hypothetical protein
MEEEKKELPEWVGGCIGALMAFVSLGMGLYILLTSFNIIPTPEENFSAPRSIVAAVGFVFVLVGILTLMGTIFSAEELRLPVMSWIQFLLILTVMAAFSGVFVWTGFGPGERAFQTSTSVGPISTHGQGNETTGRVLFGGFGMLCSLGTAWYAYAQVKNLVHGRFKSMFDRQT